MLRFVDLSRSKFFIHVGLSSPATNYPNLVHIDLSNATEMRDPAAASIAEAKNLERLLLARCKGITDTRIGCRKLRSINLERW
ncbi:hypothetical protein RHSIM_Rhsim12G0057100 [Rhododendron simsii]|uniref:Uncharacterized protein n=1 Tax=Rhododendron simsii TaxID=118357 RepID=A0A834G136_RHOSS|nr:hypothetical protein RHSIM_Rhsim12G0057100 [Rhododendron simsii]